LGGVQSRLDPIAIAALEGGQFTEAEVEKAMRAEDAACGWESVGDEGEGQVDLYLRKESIFSSNHNRKGAEHLRGLYESGFKFSTEREDLQLRSATFSPPSYQLYCDLVQACTSFAVGLYA
jgi:hypothetical protein